MDTEEDKYINQNEFILPNKRNCRFLMILSSNNDKIYIHSKVINSFDKIESNESNLLMPNTNLLSKPEIIDLKDITRKLNSYQISELALQSLFDSKLIKIEPKIKNTEEVKLIYDESEPENDNDLEDFGLIDRKKNDRLTDKQLIFLKGLINTNSLTSKQLSFKYNLSSSQITKIRRMSFN